jgi:hypothetical protein
MILKIIPCLVFATLFMLNATFSHAQDTVELEATVGKYYFSASGMVSPYASIIMTSQDFFLSSTVADENGKFMLPEALVNDGFKSFCLEAVDIKRLGTSYTCFDVVMPEGDFSKDDIFLPPTVGLSGRLIEPNASITASGYTMPEGNVDMKLGEGFSVELMADVNGYYNTELEAGIPPGKYELYAMAVYGASISEKPSRTFTVEVLGASNRLSSWITWITLFVVLFLIIIIPVIILLRRRFKRDKTKVKSKAKKPNQLQKLFFWRV